MDQSKKEKVETLNAVLMRVFQSLGNAFAVINPDIDDTMGDGVVVVSFARIGLYVIVDAPCVVRTLCGPRVVPGYVVGYNKLTPATRHHPSESEDVDTLRTQSLRDAVQEFVNLFTRSIVDGSFDR